MDPTLELLTNLNTAIAGLNDTIKENKAADNTMTANQLHGQSGLFNTPGLDRNVISAMLTPHGVAPLLPLIPTIDENPIFGSLTGFTDVIGSQPDNVCDDAPYGYMKGCNLTARYAATRFDTNTIQANKVITRVNRGDFTDLMLNGRVLGMDQLAPSSMNDQDILSIVTKAEMVGAAVQAERKLSKDIWQGTIAGGTFPGLDVQIATGQKDAETGTLCPALDSDVKDFGYSAIDGSDKDIVEYMSMIHWFLKYTAEHSGLDPVQWALVTTPNLWFELSSIYPCRYMTNRCANSAATAVGVINDSANVDMRDAMRNGKYIDINGERLPVVTDSGVFEHNSTNNANLNPGEYAASLYFVPLTIGSGFNVTYREYLDYSNFAKNSQFLLGKEDFWTDGGVYSWAIEQQKWCYKLSLLTEQRIILRTPQLAGKLQHIKYTPLQHLRSPYPESPYFADGGVSLRSTDTLNSVWL